MKLGKKIYTLRTQEGLTQEQLAEQLGVSRQSISKYEYGQSTPELEKIKLIAEIFGVTPDYLINDDIDVPKNSTKEAAADKPAFSENTSDSGMASAASADAEETEENKDYWQTGIEELNRKTDALQTQYQHLDKTLKTVCVLTFIAMFVITAINIYQSSLISALQQSQNNTVYYEEARDIEVDLVDKIFSAYEYGVKKYHEADNTVDFYISCKPINYSDTTIISASLSFENGAIYDYALSEKSGFFSGTITLPLTADNFSLAFLIDNQGEKQNVDLCYSHNLLDELDWHPIITIESTGSDTNKNKTTTFFGGVYIQSGDSSGLTASLPYISDIKLVFCTGEHILFEHTLTKQELEDVRKGYGPFIPYEFDVDGDATNQSADIYVEYKNSNINKTLRCGDIISLYWIISQDDSVTLGADEEYEEYTVQKIIMDE